MECCSFTGTRAWIYIILIILIFVVIGFQIKDTLFSKKSVKQPEQNPFNTDYPVYPNDVTALQGAPQYEHFMPDTRNYIGHQKPQIQEVTSLNDIMSIPSTDNYSFDQVKFVQNYTKQPRSTQLQNISSLNNIEVGIPQTSYDYIPYDPSMRFYTPTYHIIQDRPNISNFIRA